MFILLVLSIEMYQSRSGRAVQGNGSSGKKKGERGFSVICWVFTGYSWQNVEVLAFSGFVT